MPYVNKGKANLQIRKKKNDHAWRVGTRHISGFTKRVSMGKLGQDFSH